MRISVPWLNKILIRYDKSKTEKEFFNAVYEYFKQDFVDTMPQFNNKNVGLQINPLIDGKEYTFYHVTTEGEDEKNRTIDIQRCERIRWIRTIIESGFIGLKIWPKRIKSKNRIIIWFEEVDYVIVLESRKTYYSLITAYLVNQNHTRNKFRKEYKQFQKAKTALE